MSNAIERIKGYCCEVTQAQWEELVRVADEVGLQVLEKSRTAFVDVNFKFALLDSEDLDLLLTTPTVAYKLKLIPFPDFLAKMRGEEWVPKAGEMVEVEVGKLYPTWSKAEMVCYHKGYYICNEVNNWQYMPFKLNQIRPIRPTITRAEAEAQLGKRIID